MNARSFVVCFLMFGVAAALGAGFALFGPVAIIRIFGTIAFVAGAAGCAVQLYALHELAPRVYALLRRRYLGRGYYNVADTLPGLRRSAIAGYR